MNTLKYAIVAMAILATTPVYAAEPEIFDSQINVKCNTNASDAMMTLQNKENENVFFYATTGNDNLVIITVNKDMKNGWSLLIKGKDSDAICMIAANNREVGNWHVAADMLNRMLNSKKK